MLPGHYRSSFKGVFFSELCSVRNFADNSDQNKISDQWAVVSSPWQLSVISPTYIMSRPLLIAELQGFRLGNCCNMCLLHIFMSFPHFLGGSYKARLFHIQIIRANAAIDNDSLSKKEEAFKALDPLCVFWSNRHPFSSLKQLEEQRCFIFHSLWDCFIRINHKENRT